MIAKLAIALLAVLITHCIRPTFCIPDDGRAVAGFITNPLVAREEPVIESRCQITKWGSGLVDVFAAMHPAEGWDCTQVDQMYEWLIEKCKGAPATMGYFSNRCTFSIHFKGRGNLDENFEAALCAAGYLQCPVEDFPFTRGPFKPGDCEVRDWTDVKG